jgi:drug/metabolite transporter (DMT)-like permease
METKLAKPYRPLLNTSMHFKTILRNYRGQIYLVLASLLWGSMSVAAKLLMLQQLPAGQLVGMRLILTSSGLLGFLLVRPLIFRTSSTSLPMPRGPSQLLPSKDLMACFFILGVGGIALNYLFYFKAIESLTVAAAILIQYLAPFFIALWNRITTGSSLSFGQTVAFFITLLGCGLVTQVDLAGVATIGIGYGLAAALTYAFYTLLSEKLIQKWDGVQVQFWTFLFAAIFWNFLYPPLAADQFSYNFENISLILWVGFAGTLIPFALLLKGLAIIKSSQASITATLEPVFAAIFAFFILGEPLKAPQVLGVLLVVSSIVYINRKPNQNLSAA